MRKVWEVNYGDVQKGDVVRTIWQSREVIRIHAVERSSESLLRVEYEVCGRGPNTIVVGCAAGQLAGDLLHRPLPEGTTPHDVSRRMHLAAFQLWKNTMAPDAFKEPTFQGCVDAMEELIDQWQLNRPLPKTDE